MEIPSSSDDSPHLSEPKSLCLGSACSPHEEQEVVFGLSPPLILAMCKPWSMNTYFLSRKKKNSPRQQVQEVTRADSINSFPEFFSILPPTRITRQRACIWTRCCFLQLQFIPGQCDFKIPAFESHVKAQSLEISPRTSHPFFTFSSPRESTEGALYHARYITPAIRVAAQ